MNANRTSAERTAARTEFEAFYRAYPTDCIGLEQEIARFRIEHPESSSTLVKRKIYETIGSRCSVHVFRNYPFYFEVVSGRKRNTGSPAAGISGFPPEPSLGGYLMRNSDLPDRYKEWCAPWFDTNLVHSTLFVDFAHTCAGYDTILRSGFRGLLRQVETRLESASEPREREFLESVGAGLNAAVQLCERFSEEAERLLETEQDETVRANLMRIADTARRIPSDPPGTFYEALNTILLVREFCMTLDGMAVATFGQIDRLLEPYYRHDLERGLIDEREARELLGDFLAYTDLRFDLHHAPNGTNISVNIGGCDENGKPVCNALTRACIQAFLERGLVNPKLEARVSRHHPPEYTELLGDLVSSGANVLTILNDDVIIPSLTEQGKSIEDARTYVAGGCQEIVLPDTETNCRAYFYVNLLQILRMVLLPEEWSLIGEQRIEIPSGPWADYESFHRDYFRLVRHLCQRFATALNGFERQWVEFNPCPFQSSMIEDCIQKATDLTQGGARYNPSSLSMVGIANLVDSLFVLKTIVFEQGRYSMEQMRHFLSTDFAGAENERKYLIDRVDRYGQDTDAINAFAARVLSDVAQASSGMPNARGGVYEASLFTFYSYEWLKEKTGATPDGRRDGEALSRGISPSERTPGVNAATMLHTLTALDMTEFPASGVLYLDMPYTLQDMTGPLFGDIIRTAIVSGLCSMDFDIVDRDTLIKARTEPDRYRSLTVRVCGYSALFVSLEEEIQREIIQRASRRAS